MARTTFPLRFDDDVTRRALEEISTQTGLSMNRLVQDAIAVQLQFATRVLQARLESAIEDLKAYGGEWSDREMQAFARAEVEHRDPIEGRMVDERRDDPFGRVAALADSVE